VPLLKSLFCYLGSDTRARFALIFFASHLFFIIFTSLFSFSILASLCILILSCVVLSLTTKRRLTDAHLGKNWLIYPNALFVIITLITIMTNESITYWLMLLSLTSYSLLLTYRSKSNCNYIMGYNGPIDLSFYQQTNNRNKRVEPTFSQQSNTVFPKEGLVNLPQQNISAKKLSNSELDLGETIREKLSYIKNSRIILTATVSIVVIAMFVTFLVSEPTNQLNQEIADELTQSSLDTAVKRTNTINLPDDFSLMINEFDGIVINWPAELSDKPVIWDIRSATGDNKCQNITFNNGDKVRTLKVIVEEDDNYFAEFSPLDNTTLIKSIAMRTNFTLCGYTFSLKGSQAVLGKNPYYADIINF